MAEFEALIIKNIAAVGGVGVGIALIQVSVLLLSFNSSSESRPHLRIVSYDTLAKSNLTYVKVVTVVTVSTMMDPGTRSACFH